MKKWILFFCCIILLLISTGCSKTSAKNTEAVPRQQHGLIIAGSGSNIPHIRILVDKFNAIYNLDLRVPNSIGSVGAIKGVSEGSIDLGFTSRPLSEAERATGLQEIQYAKMGLIIACHDDVPDNDVSVEELIQIYRGEKTAWSNGKWIVPLTMYLGDSTNEVLIADIPGFKETLTNAIQTKRALEFYNNQSLDLALGNTPSSIGFTNLVPRQGSGVKTMKLNGIAPSKENILNGSYRWTKNVYFIYKDPLNKDVKEFIDFTFSDQGRQLLEANGSIPLSR